jgi:uncharacterized protein YbjT (DUF2867 family)
VVILLTGASGFIGQYLVRALLARGHHVMCAGRSKPPIDHPKLGHVAADFTRDTEAQDWKPHLRGIDIVINAVGIIREQGAQTFRDLHERAPCALFQACVDTQVRLVVQISALGADEQAQSRYHLSKKRADDFLRSLPLHSVILQPSLVFGLGGTSATLFTILASMPMIFLPAGGRQQVQPVHIDDVVGTVLATIERPPRSGTLIPVVGPEPMSFGRFLSVLRQAMRMGSPLYFPVPRVAMRLAAAAGKLLPGGLLDPETLQMLERGNTGDEQPVSQLLGRRLTPVAEFVPRADAAVVRTQAKLGWLLPMLRISIALVWIVTAIVSLGLYPVKDSYALLARTGITGELAPVALYGAAVLDLLFGIGTLVLRKRRWLWLAQLALIIGYTIIISMRLPEFWLHPYGPLLKNLPMIAAIWLLLELEQPGRK